MLRITIHETTSGRTIQLKGKVMVPWAQEFGRLWRALELSRARRELQLDLRDVALVDAQGETAIT
jgi:hypothetical protein